MFIKLRVLCIFVIMLFLFTGQAYMSEKVDLRPIYGHQGPDGIISFKVAYYDRSFWGSDQLGMMFEKRFTNQGPLCLLSLHRQGNMAKKAVISTSLIFDNTEVILPQAEGSNKTTGQEGIKEQYVLGEQLLTLLGKAKEMHVKFNQANGKATARKLLASELATVQKLMTLVSSDYIRAGQVFYEEKQADQQGMYPQLFIPGVKPDIVGQALVYKTNVWDYKGKIELSPLAYYVTARKDWKSMEFQGKHRFSFHNDDVPYIAVTLEPYNDGVWMEANVMGLGWYRQQNGVSHPTFSDAAGRGPGLFGDMSGRNKTYEWMEHFLDVYYMLHGKYDYGFEWDPVRVAKKFDDGYKKRWNRGPFPIGRINAKQFPELGDIKEGDILSSVNGLSTARMIKTDIDVRTVCSGNPAIFVFRDAAGNEKTVIVIPRFIPAGQRPDFTNGLSKIPKHYFKVTDKALHRR